MYEISTKNYFPAFKIKDQFRYKAYHSGNFKDLRQVRERLTEAQIRDIKIVSQVLPFRTNNFVVNELIDWDNPFEDPIFILNFPQKEMLSEHHYNLLASALNRKVQDKELNHIIRKIVSELNPHPGGQIDKNTPEMEGIKLNGIQHKYKETLLIFPKQGQTCHAYCTFCFRWPQFIADGSLKMETDNINMVVRYLMNHPEITDILFTGGDPLIMRTKVLENYINRILDLNLPNLISFRFGTKTLTYWPFRFLTDSDADELLRLFEKIIHRGYHLSIMAHFNHYKELRNNYVVKAIKRVQSTGALIRTQSPILNHINAEKDIWEIMLKEQTELKLIPYYMFLPRDTGAREYFKVPLVKAWMIYREAIKNVSGLSRTIRGPVMSSHFGKILFLGVSEIYDKLVSVFTMIQGRNEDWVNKPFFAEYCENAGWIDEIKPAFGEDKFFFQLNQ